MRAYPPDLLDVQAGDGTRLAAPPGPSYQALFPQLRAAAAAGLPWIADTVKTTRGEDEAIFDALYRRGHTLHGMAALLQLPKLAHVLGMMDLALDLGRDLQTFERHSLGYLVALLARTAQDIFDDLATAGGSDRDTRDILDECRTYLAGPFQQAPKPLPAPGTSEPQAEAAAVALEPQAEAAAVAPDPGGADDGPEELEIPPDKIGLTSDFCEESRESLSLLGRRLVELEGAADPVPIVNDLFRSVHTVKGGARLLKVRKMELLAHRMESLLDGVRKNALPVSATLVDLLLDGRRLLEEMVDEVASRGPLRTRIGPTLAALEAGRMPVPVAPAPAAERPELPTQAAAPLRPAASDTIRVPTEKLDDVLNTASEIFIGRIQLAGDVSRLAATVRQSRQALEQMHEFGIQSVLRRLSEANRRLLGELQAMLPRRGGPPMLDKLTTLVNRFHSELSADTAQHGLSTSEELNLELLSIDEVRKQLQKNVEHLEQLSGRLQAGAMGFRMVPIAHLFDRFPVQVRELARQLGKKVHLEVGGGDTELDKAMINQLADPLLHILRNSLDHGVEDGQVRLAAGKPEAGQMALRAYYQGSNAVIEVSDDGRGIDTDRVLAKAIESGVVDADKAGTLSRAEIFQLIFVPGLSTAATLSTVSGRGVGMDVVMTAISQVQGSISVDSMPGQGTTMRMKLPLTLAVVGILLVRERSHMFAFPIQHVDEILMVSPGDLRDVGTNTLYGHHGTTISVMTLSSLLDFPPSTFSEREAPMVILAEGERRVGILVDAVLGRQEVLIKSLGRLLRKSPFVMGCTILSDSRLVLILNAWELVNSQARKPVAVVQPTGEQAERRQHALLVVDDSGTQRTYLGSLLSQAGYVVGTAENGFEALKRLRSRRCSACCVDIVMPLMDGFEFVERLRQLPEHRDTPVFLITGHEGQTVAGERDRAIQLGVRELFRKPVDPAVLLQALDGACLKKVGRQIEGGAGVRSPAAVG